MGMTGVMISVRVLRVSVACLAIGAACGGDPTGSSGGMVTLTTLPAPASSTMLPMTPVPVVQLTDAAGNARPQAGVTVTAHVVSGDGIIVAGGSVTTDAAGVARFPSLTLGAAKAEGGAVTLRFSAPGYSDVTATTELQCALATIQVGATVNDALREGDCVRAGGSSSTGSRYREYELETTSATPAIVLADSSAAFRAIALIRGPNQPSIYLGRRGQTGSGLAFKILLPPGKQRILATTADSALRGAYKLSVVAVPENEPSVCSMQFHTPLATTQQLNGSCSGNTQQFPFLLGPGHSITATVASSAFSPRVEIYQELNQSQLAVTATGVGTVTVSWTNTAAEPITHTLRVSAPGAGSGGMYTIQATISGT